MSLAQWPLPDPPAPKHSALPPLASGLLPHYALSPASSLPPFCRQRSTAPLPSVPLPTRECPRPSGSLPTRKRPPVQCPLTSDSLHPQVPPSTVPLPQGLPPHPQASRPQWPTTLPLSPRAPAPRSSHWPPTPASPRLPSRLGSAGGVGAVAYAPGSEWRRRPAASVPEGRAYSRRCRLARRSGDVGWFGWPAAPRSRVRALGRAVTRPLRAWLVAGRLGLPAPPPPPRLPRPAYPGPEPGAAARGDRGGP